MSPTWRMRYYALPHICCSQPHVCGSAWVSVKHMTNGYPRRLAQPRRMVWGASLRNRLAVATLSTPMLVHVSATVTEEHVDAPEVEVKQVCLRQNRLKLQRYTLWHGWGHDHLGCDPMLGCPLPWSRDRSVPLGIPPSSIVQQANTTALGVPR